VSALPDRACRVKNRSRYRPTWKSFSGVGFHEGATVLEQVVADGAGPEHAEHETPAFIIRAARGAHLHFLAEQAARSEQAHARRGDVATQQRECPAVFGAHLHGVDEVDAVFAAALAPPGSLLDLSHDPAGRLRERGLVVLLLPETFAHRRGEVIAA